MITRHWYVNLVGGTRLPEQDSIRLLQQTFPHRLELESEPTNAYDPNAVRVLAVIGDERRFIGYVPNRAACTQCDPDVETFGHADYKYTCCPACGATAPNVWVRGIATQLVAVMGKSELKPFVEVLSFYQNRRKQVGVKVYLRIEVEV